MSGPQQLGIWLAVAFGLVTTVLVLIRSDRAKWARRSREANEEIYRESQETWERAPRPAPAPEGEP